MKRHCCTIAFAFLALLAFPRTGSAGIGEIILEMSGPQMFGFPVECRIGLTDGNVDVCRFLWFRMGGKDSNGLPKPIPDRKLWLFLEGGPYFSTGKNNQECCGDDAPDVIYEKFHEVMFTFDPMLAIRTARSSSGAFSMYHGILGMSYNFLVGPDFKGFSNVAFKLRPIGVTIHRFNIEYNARIYPSGFDATDFGKVPSNPSERKPELVHGFSVYVNLD